ncbi:MAG: hypothetical protein OES38_21680, partial [Gammaproteobacteria bacterium]|nr:hypothetical protein [Gammaproteobacteria bacterium]
MQTDLQLAWSGKGWAHVDTPDGEFEGKVQLNVEAPTRARLIFESSGAFGLVSERVAVALPGDGWVLTHQKRADQLDRLPFAESRLRQWLPLGQPADVFALMSGLPPWPSTQELGRLLRQARIVRVEKDGRRLTYRLLSIDGNEVYLLRLDDEVLVSFEWSVRGERRLRIEYHEWGTQDGLRRPAVLRIAAPQSSVTAEVTLDDWRRRD